MSDYMELSCRKGGVLEQLTDLTVHHEPPGVLAEHSCWACLIGTHLYIALSLEELLLQLVVEWEHDKHYVGELLNG